MSDLSPFWDKLADKYASKPIADQTAYRTKLARTQEFLRPDMELLEFAQQAGVTNVTFERGDIGAMSIAPESYDIVLGLSVLHLLENRDAVIGKVFDILKPGGRFVSSTACIGDSMRALSVIAPIGKWLGKLPHLDIMTRDDLRRSMTRAGFTIEHDWRPSKIAAVFLVARKPL
jgi:SAM-dependent methyltransferase